MGKNIFEEQANFLSAINRKIYIAILKVFYANHKFELEFKEGKEANANELYNYCKELEEFENFDRQQFETALDQLCKWGNLDSRPNLEVITRWEDFDKKTSLYSITNASIIFIKALEEFENEEIDNSNLSTSYLDEIVKNLKILNKANTNLKNDTEICNAWLQIKENYELLNVRYTDYLKKFSKNSKNELEYTKLLKYKEDIKLNITEFLTLLEEKKNDDIYPLIETTEEKFKRYLLPIIAEKIAKENLSSYEEEEIKNRKSWENLREWFSNRKSSKSRRIMEYTRVFLQSFFRNINTYYGLEDMGIDMKKEYTHILELFASCNTKEEADKLSAYIFGVNKTRHYKLFEDISVSDDSKSTYTEDSIIFPFYKVEKQYERKRYERRGRPEKTPEELELEKNEYLKELELEEYINNEILKEKIDVSDFTNQKLRKEVLILLQELYYKGFTDEEGIANTGYGKKYKISIPEINEELVTLTSEDGTYTMPRCIFTQIL
ncbi:MAG: DUF2397 family protein [Fusobacterium sp.]|uniref:DUF2397 family protein n=1 Tax=Fusobacterium sp. TaxID=68766 RepID=UPI0015A51A34|nr:DUF2397 family protein [uncultured Fusobacterium sp.]